MVFYDMQTLTPRGVKATKLVSKHAFSYNMEHTHRLDLEIGPNTQKAETMQMSQNTIDVAQR